MTNTEILEKAIKKAIDGGWDVKLNPTLKAMQEKIGDKTYKFFGLSWHMRDELLWVNVEYEGGSHSYCFKPQDYIYSHEFAKSLWPQSYKHNMAELLPNGAIHGRIHQLTHWQRHLQRMVLADDPIKYLGEHLDD